MTLAVKLLIFCTYTGVLSLLMHRFFVMRSERYKIKKANISAERWSSQTKPVLGGVTFFAIFIFSILNYALFFDANNLLQPEILGSILVVTIAFLMGLADDMLNTPPNFKFIFQILSAVILIYSGLYIQVFDTEWFNYLLTVFWVVGIMNSVNMLDNMDAITTSVSITILLGALFILYIFQPYAGVMVMLTAGVLVALLSFLYYNWNPSKMYMGDNGSQFLGAFLAIIGIQVFWNGNTTGHHEILYPFLLAFLAFIVPISDTTAVTINRLLRGQSPFIGGRDHTTHHLSYFGLSDRKVAGLLLSVNLIFVVISAVIILVPYKLPFPIWVFAVLGAAVLITLYSITKISKPAK